MIDRFFSWAVKQRTYIISAFKIVYFGLVVLLVIGSRSLLHQDANTLLFYQIGIWFGRTAVVLFILTLIPGMANRFGVRHKLIAILKIFRRYIGILMYLFAVIHFIFVRLIALADGINALFPLQNFEIFGLLASMSLFFLFITSNDFSVKKLGIWWYRIHRLIYLGMWFILFHVALQNFSLWTVLIGTTVLLMMVSFLYQRIKSRQTSSQ